MVLARPESSREIGRRAALSRLSGEDAGAGGSAGSGPSGAREFASPGSVQRVDTVGPGAAGLRRHRNGLSELQPGCGPGYRSSDRSGGRHGQHNLYRRCAGRSLEIHECGY